MAFAYEADYGKLVFKKERKIIAPENIWKIKFYDDFEKTFV